MNRFVPVMAMPPPVPISPQPTVSEVAPPRPTIDSRPVTIRPL